MTSAYTKLAQIVTGPHLRHIRFPRCLKTKLGTQCPPPNMTGDLLGRWEKDIRHANSCVCHNSSTCMGHFPPLPSLSGDSLGISALPSKLHITRPNHKSVLQFWMLHLCTTEAKSLFSHKYLSFLFGLQANSTFPTISPCRLRFYDDKS